MDDLQYKKQKPAFKLVMIGSKLFVAPIKGILDRVEASNKKNRHPVKVA
jgi:hypothetical protein